MTLPHRVLVPFAIHDFSCSIRRLTSLRLTSRLYDSPATAAVAAAVKAAQAPTQAVMTVLVKVIEAVIQKDLLSA
jgi:hypothetical protein